MVEIATLVASLNDRLAEWNGLRLSQLLYNERDTARLVVIVLLAISLAVLMARSVIRRRAGRGQMALPAVLPLFRTSAFSFLRHSPVLLFLLGLPMFVVALADPYTSLTRQEMSFPGRRIGLVIDTSSSMLEPFTSETLAKGAPSNASFFTAVGAAESFVRRRIGRNYKDLMALIQFGDEAYVVTPFTIDYDNILLSLSLINDLDEFYQFPDQGTTIGTAIQQCTDLFKAFNFLNAAGNLMIVISDGRDTKTEGARLGSHTVDTIVASAREAEIPVYFIRTVYGSKLGAQRTDPIWQTAVEKTGGKFYAAGDEASMIAAMDDIDKLTTGGKVDIKMYSTQLPRFSVFSLAAVALWLMALTLKMTIPFFRTFP